MHTYHLHINGIVQGVGFRPMIFNLAKEMGLLGYVRNGSDGVHIYFNAEEEIADQFLKKIVEKAPANSKIVSSDLYKEKEQNFKHFSIVTEETDNCIKKVLLSPDAGICSDCRKELHDKSNSRYRYPFITCTQCGPRYSIINEIPYERHSTSMQKFLMCMNCNEEYNTVTDRRFFAQINSCAECGIQLSMHENDSSLLSNDSETVLLHTKKYLQEGKIIAAKGIGGYLLLCDANNPLVIQALRNRKHRLSKPFAVLFPDIQTVEDCFFLSGQEAQLLNSEVAPIVLLYPKEQSYQKMAVRNIAPGLNRLGIMLPGNPLLDLISKDFGGPLIATSANISGSPIVYKDEDALIYLSGIADYMVGYNRDIIIPQDDSVVQVSKYAVQQIILRRSRGYAPSFLTYQPKNRATVISTGAHLKSSFTISVNDNVFVSQYLGSGESYESQKMYKDCIELWLRVYGVIPETILTDLHPGYFSHQYALSLAEKNGTGIQFVQHHEAHFAAVLAENELLSSAKPVLGVIWDGTGLGSDGNIWGGEFFMYENNEIQRRYHFKYFPVIAGDKTAQEPRIAALCAARDTWTKSDNLRKKFTAAEWHNYQALIRSSHLFTSSVGRIFDAVASLLDVCDKQNYEGEAAMYLQALAETYVENNGFIMNNSYFKEGVHDSLIPTASLIQGVYDDIAKGESKNYIAAKFHYSLVSLIGIVANHTKVSDICFSGGVFQNSLLIDWIQYELKDIYALNFHKHLSPNDENISFGQFVYHDNNLQSMSHLKKNSNERIIHNA